MDFEMMYHAEFDPISSESPLGSLVFANGKVYTVVDYEITGNRKGVVGMDREGNEQSLYDFEPIQYRTCGRCGGSGRYSYNLKDGSRCYGCSGVGRQMLAPAGLPQSIRAECVDPLPRFKFASGDQVRCEFIGFSKTRGTPLYHATQTKGQNRGLAFNLRLVTIEKHFRTDG